MKLTENSSHEPKPGKARDKGWAVFFLALAALLTYIMYLHVSYVHVKMQWGIVNEGWSAPASVAYLEAIPYLCAIVVCAGLSVKFYRRGRRKD